MRSFPIIDLRAAALSADANAPQEPLVLITHTSAGVIGLKVDEVRRIVNIAPDALPAAAAARCAAFAASC